MKKKLKIIILLGILTFVTFESAYANSPIGGAMVIALPWFSSLVSSGLALIVVILIEMLVLKQKLDLKYFEAGKLSLYANIFSTLMGMIIVLAYSSSFSVFLLFWILGSIFLLNFFNSISKKTGFLKHFASCKILLPLPFFFHGFNWVNFW